MRDLDHLAHLAVYGSVAWLVFHVAALVISLVFSVLVNGLAVVGMLTARQTRRKLTQGLLKMYEDAGIRQYYDVSLLTNYSRRYLIFTAIIGLSGLLAVVIPLVVFQFP